LINHFVSSRVIRVPLGESGWNLRLEERNDVCERETAIKPDKTAVKNIPTFQREFTGAMLYFLRAFPNARRIFAFPIELAQGPSLPMGNPVRARIRELHCS